MNISQLIEQLEFVRNNEGDIEVNANNECGSATHIVNDDIYVWTDNSGQKLLMIDA